MELNLVGSIGNESLFISNYLKTCNNINNLVRL